MKNRVGVKERVVIRQLVQGEEAEIGFGNKEFYSEIQIAPDQVEVLRNWISLKALDPQEYLDVIAAGTCMAEVMDELDEAHILYSYLYANSSGEVALRPVK